VVNLVLVYVLLLVNLSHVVLHVSHGGFLLGSCLPHRRLWHLVGLELVNGVRECLVLQDHVDLLLELVNVGNALKGVVVLVWLWVLAGEAIALRVLATVEFDNRTACLSDLLFDCLVDCLGGHDHVARLGSNSCKVVGLGMRLGLWEGPQIVHALLLALERRLGFLDGLLLEGLLHESWRAVDVGFDLVTEFDVQCCSMKATLGI